MFIKKFVLYSALLFLFSTLHAHEEEQLFISRIIDFFEEGDLKLAEKHSDEFLVSYPNSPFVSSVLLLKGEILFKKGRYDEAINIFNSIQDPSLFIKIKTGIGWTLYHAKRFEPLENFAKEYLHLGNLFHFFYAESLFRQGLQFFEQGQLELATLYLSNAEPHFQSLLNTEKNSFATLALGEIYRLTGQSEKALKLYEAVAKNPSIEPFTLRVHAAIFLAKHNAHQSKNLLKELWLNGSGQAGSEEAALYWLETALKLSDFSEILENKSAIFNVLFVNKPLGHYFTAQAALCLKATQPESDLSYEEIFNDLNIYLNFEEESPSLPRFFAKACAQMVDVSLSLQNFQAGEKWLNRLKSLHLNVDLINDGLIAEKLLEFSNALNSVDKEKSTKYLQSCIETYKNSSDERAQLAVFHARIAELKNCEPLSVEEYWEKESALLEIYHETPFYKEALSYCIEASNDYLKRSSLCYHTALHHHRIFILSELLKCSLEEREKINRKLELAYSYLYSGKTFSAKQLLLEIKNASNSHSQGRLYYLLAVASQNSLAEFNDYAEKALTLTDHPEDQLPLHMKLFNSYLSLNDKENAALHLYTALKKYDRSSEIVLDRESLKWAGRYYYDRAKELHDSLISNLHAENEIESPLDRAFYIYSTLFKMDGLKRLNIDSFIDEDRDLYYFALLSRWKGHESFSKDLLQQLADLKQRFPDRHFYSTDLAHLHLAEYFEKEQPNKALELYQELLNSPCPASIWVPAKLAFCKLKYKTESIGSEKGHAFEVFEGLRQLKTKREALTEPCHLEAGFELIEYQSAAQISDDKRLFNLRRYKEELVNQNDVASKDYHSLIESDPEKLLIYTAYLRLIDAAILECESKLSQNNQEKITKANKAFALYSTLRQGKYALNPYLREKAYQGMGRLR